MIDWWNGNRIAATALGGISLPMFVVGIALYWKYQSLFPINAGSIFFGLLSGISLFAYWALIWAVLILEKDTPCISSIVRDAVVLNLCAWAMEVKAWTLLFNFETTANIMALRLDPRGPQGWFLRNRSLVSTVVLRRATFVAVSLFLLTLGVNLALAPEYQREGFCPFGDEIDHASPGFRVGGIITVYGWLGLHAVVVIAMAWRLSKHQSDAQGIKVSLSGTMLLAVASYPMSFVFNMVVEPSWANQHVLHLGCSMAVVAFVLHIWWPLWQTGQLGRCPCSRNSRALVHGATSSVTLERLLSTPDGFTAFLAHMRAEFAAENLIFCERERGYRDLLDPDRPGFALDSALTAALTEADAIFDLFVAPGSSMQVNLSSARVAAVTADLAALRQALDTGSGSNSGQGDSAHLDNATPGLTPPLAMASYALPAPARVDAGANKTALGTAGASGSGSGASASASPPGCGAVTVTVRESSKTATPLGSPQTPTVRRVPTGHTFLAAGGQALAEEKAPVGSSPLSAGARMKSSPLRTPSPAPRNARIEFANKRMSGSFQPVGLSSPGSSGRPVRVKTASGGSVTGVGASKPDRRALLLATPSYALAANLFVDAQKDIFSLMTTDSFPRFRSTAAFAQLERGLHSDDPFRSQHALDFSAHRGNRRRVGSSSHDEVHAVSSGPSLGGPGAPSRQLLSPSGGGRGGRGAGSAIRVSEASGSGHESESRKVRAGGWF